MNRLVFMIVSIIALVTMTSAELDKDAVHTICQNKPYQIESLEDLKTFSIEMRAFECVGFSIDPVYYLVKELSDPSYNDNVCSNIYIDGLRRMVFLRISRVPLAVQNFAVNHMLALSKVCKERLVKNFSTLSREFLENDTKAKEMLNNIVDNGGIQVAGSDHLKSLFTLNDLLLEPRKTEIVMVESDQLIQKQKNCLRLKKFYGDLILPVVKLNTIGFDYSSAELDDQMNELERSSEDPAKWYAAVFVCEALDLIVVFGSSHPFSETKTRLLSEPGEPTRRPKYIRKSPYGHIHYEKYAPVEMTSLVNTRHSPEIQAATNSKKYSLSDQVDEMTKKLKRYAKQVKRSPKEVDEKAHSPSAVALKLWAKDYVSTLRHERRKFYKGLVKSTAKGVGITLALIVGFPILLVMALEFAIRKAFGFV